MRYDDFRRSDDIEDRRDDSGGGLGGAAALVFRWVAAGSASAPSSCSVLSVTAFGIDPRILIGGAQVFNGGGQARPIKRSPFGDDKTGAPTTRWAA